MIDRASDPRTEDRIEYELIRTDRGTGAARVVGFATYTRGATSVEADEDLAVTVRELLARPFVDRVQADERPRGYRRSARGSVDMLVPGMPQHFVARMRGLWLPYPDGTVVTARVPAGAADEPAAPVRHLDVSENTPQVIDPSIRRMTLAVADETAGTRALVDGHAPLEGTRSVGDAPGPHRTDCGWLV
jgi:hypothetical protein